LLASRPQLCQFPWIEGYISNSLFGLRAESLQKSVKERERCTTKEEEKTESKQGKTTTQRHHQQQDTTQSHILNRVSTHTSRKVVYNRKSISRSNALDPQEISHDRQPVSSYHIQRTLTIQKNQTLTLKWASCLLFISPNDSSALFVFIHGIFQPNSIGRGQASIEAGSGR
jgi:hypothetical protein